MLRFKSCPPTCTPESTTFLLSGNDNDKEETAVGYVDQIEAAVDQALENVDEMRIEVKEHVNKY